MKKEELSNFIKNKIDNNSIFQPLLLCWNLFSIDILIWEVLWEIMNFYEVDKNNLFVLKDDNESLKISDVKLFVSKSNIKSNYKFQIFLFENIQRLTLESSNSLLKFLEEPWIWNIVILTSKSDSMILDTILSRVVKIDINWEENINNSIFFKDMISSFFEKNDISIYWYFFDDKKIEKGDYLKFLETLFLYLKDNSLRIDLLEEIEKSINFIIKNNSIPKYEIDKILLLLK